MKKGIDLLNGPIAGSLARLALPIMGTSLIQMAYNLTDMLWIGRISSNAVAAVGAAGMYIWLSAGFTMLARMGGQVLTAQSLGAGKEKKAVEYATASLQMGLLFGLLYGVISVIFNNPLIGFFRLNSPEVILDARWYLAITCGGIVFNFMNQILTGLLTAMGNSIVTFWSTTIGLVINLVLDPLLIFGPGPLPRHGVKGAAIATVFAQVMVFVIYILRIRKDTLIFSNIHILQRPSIDRMKDILLVGLPAAVQNLFFTGVSMLIARLIAGWGDAAVAVQKVGSQIESISWMTAEGFGSAVNAFVAQNYGAGKNDRVRKGYFAALKIMCTWGLYYSRPPPFSRNPVSHLHPGGRHPPHGRRLSADSGPLPALYVHRNRISRCISGTGQNTAPFPHRNRLQRTSHPPGNHPVRYRPETEWYLVEHQHLKRPQRHNTARLAAVLYVHYCTEKILKIAI